MSIDWQNFTPATSLAGGALIGLSCVMLLAMLGRIAGISGIVGAMLQRQTASEYAWRVAFVVGLLFSPWIYRLVAPYPQVEFITGTGGLVVAGLLVGLGTRYGSGCTSGHGVCGLSRLSGRSLVAVISFMGAGFLTVFLLRHVFA